MQATIVPDWLWTLCRAPLPDWDWELDLAWQLLQAEKAADTTWSQSLRQQLIIGNLPLAAVLARRHAHSSDEFSELFSAGALGLVEAASRYDPARPVLFRSFARYRVRGAILSSLSRRLSAHGALSLDRPLRADAHYTLADIYVAPLPPIPTDPRPLYRALHRLPDELRQVIQARYGLGVAAHTQTQTGLRLNLSRDQVQHREYTALAQLRVLLTSDGRGA
jgi:DNA-directed RNA polymerase specialized sigma subunit